MTLGWSCNVEESQLPHHQNWDNVWHLTKADGWMRSSLEVTSNSKICEFLGSQETRGHSQSLWIPALGLHLLLQPHSGPNSGPTMQTAREEIRRGGGVETFLPAGMNGKSMKRMMGKRERQWGDEAGVCSLELSAFCITCMLRNHKMYMHQGFRAQDSSQWAGAINVFLGFWELKGKHRGILKSFLGRSFRFHPKWVLVWDQKHLAQIWAILLKTVSKSFKLPEPELPHLETGGNK